MDNVTGMAIKATKKYRSQPNPAVRREHTPPEAEYRFDRLGKEEYEDCFRYEIQRYRIPLDSARIEKELASIPTDAEMPMEPGEAPANLCTRKQELEEQFAELKDYERPWLGLREMGIPPRLSSSQRWLVRYDLPSKRRTAKYTYEPVQVLSELDVLTRARLLLADSKVEKLEIFIDWTKPDTRLAESFLRLVKRMCKRGGRAGFKEEKRGRPKSPIELQLFALAVWRCSKCTMTHAKIWDFLVPLRKKWQIALSNKRQLGEFSRHIERLISQ